MRWLNPFNWRPKRLIVIVLIAALLVTQPAKPAHAFAFAVVAAAATFLAAQLTELFAADGKLKGVLLAIETRMPILLTTVEMKINENVVKAQAAAHQQMLDRMAKKASLDERPTDILQANCQAITGIADSNNLRAKQTNVYIPLTGRQHELQNPTPASGKRNRSGSTDTNRQDSYEYSQHCDNYATENDLQAAIAGKCTKPDGTPIKTIEDIKSNPYKGADTNATSLLMDAYYEPRAFAAAYDYCYALTGNKPLNSARGRALDENIDNIQQFLVTLSDKSARDLSYYSCESALRRRLPIDNKFAIEDPKLTAKLTNLGKGSDNGDRKPADIDAAAKKLLHDRYSDPITPEAAKTLENKAQLDPENNPLPPYLIKGQAVSMKQNDNAVFIDRFTSGEFATRRTGHPAQQQQLLLWSRVSNLSMLWMQYEKLEEQTLNEAIQLARLVRSAPAYGNPPTSAPVQ